MTKGFSLDKTANSGNDEFYTPPYAVEPILPFLRPHSVIWCPFDDERSHFVKRLRDLGHAVICTHVNTGTDFFTCSIPECDAIVSNPPYSKKTEVLQRLFQIGKPFAMLLGIVGLFESKERFTMFRDNPFEMLYLNKRVAYLKDYDDETPALHPPFSSAYVCSRLLPQQTMFAEVMTPTRKRKAS